MAQASCDKLLVRECDEKIRRYQEKYNQISKITGIDRSKKKMTLTNGVDGGMIENTKGNVTSRNMANGLRKSPTYILSNEEIKSIKDDIRSIGADESVFEFNKGRYTSYNDKTDKIKIRGDVLPDTNSKHPRDLMSSKAVLAHEYYGHRVYRGTNLKIGSWNDEFRASYMAAKNAPNLSDDDRKYLVLDAMERAKESGVTIKNNNFMRRILYGY